jgi:sorting nexin-13
VSTAVTAMPRNMMNNMDNVMDGLTKAFHTKDSQDELANNMKVGACLDQDHDNIPLRITLLLLDEVFGLADRNIWLRRQMITVLRQIVKTMFGDTVNKRIVDYFTSLTSPRAVSEYLTSIKEHLWPSGCPPSPYSPREDDQRKRTRVAAKAALFSSLPDELRRVIGSETSRAGLAMLFEMLQHASLNKRLVIVILEGVIRTIFPDHDFSSVFQKLHSRSSRVRNELKNSKRSPSDLRRH